jgi:hypothetical protein
MDKFEYHKNNVEFKDIRMFCDYFGYTLQDASNNKFDRADYIIREKGWIVELKSRYFNLRTLKEQYNSEIIIEIDKFEAVLKRAAETDLTPIYITKLLDGWFFVYNLLNIPQEDLKVERISAPKSTLGNKTYITKFVYKLKTDYPTNILFTKQITEE